MPETNNGLNDLDFTIDDEISEKQPQKSVYPRWISSCERNKSCPMSSEIANNAKELVDENHRLKAIQQQYEHLRIVALEGRQLLSNKVYVDFDIDNKAYKLRFEKRLRLSSQNKNYYTIRLHCDKTPNKDKQESREESACSFWNDIDLKIKLIDIGNGLVYSYPTQGNNEECSLDNNEYSLMVEEIDRTSNRLVMKMEFAQGRGQPIELSSEIQIEYSFYISTDHWGNYIERHISFDREEVAVYLKRGDYELPKQSGVCKISKDKLAPSRVSLAAFEGKQEEDYQVYRFCVDVGHLPWEVLSSTNLRVRWDCEKIFGDKSLNDIEDMTPGVAYKGMGST